MTTKTLVAGLVVMLVLFPAPSGIVLNALKDSTIHTFGAWYIWLLAGFVVFCAVLVALPISGRLKLGAPGDIPDHSTTSWLAMMFCSGIGVGILVFSVSEPISHFTANPATLASGNQSTAAEALSFVFLHWGFSAWSCYAVIGLALGLACHRQGQPMTMRSAIAPLFGRWMNGSMGHIVDILSILAIVAGITTTIVLGLEQICAGLSALTGSDFFADQLGNPPLAALLAALVVAISIAMGSILSGVDRGVKWVANLGMILTFGLLGLFAASGAPAALGGLFLEASGTYFATLPAQMTTIYARPETAAWQADWTMFYWAWWIAFAPFVGLFLARISRGRTVREFILGAVIGPSLMCFLWFSILGGTALSLESGGTAAGRIIAAPHAFRIYETIDIAFSPGVLVVIKAIVALLFLVLIVAASSAAIIAIKSIGAAGGRLAETPVHSMIWAAVIAAVTGAVMAVGGVASIRHLMIIAAVPFSGIMALMLPAVLRVVLTAWRAGD